LQYGGRSTVASAKNRYNFFGGYQPTVGSDGFAIGGIILGLPDRS
jgi:hypothetical protein